MSRAGIAGECGVPLGPRWQGCTGVWAMMMSDQDELTMRAQNHFTDPIIGRIQVLGIEHHQRHMCVLQVGGHDGSEYHVTGGIAELHPGLGDGTRPGMVINANGGGDGSVLKLVKK